MNPWPFVVAAYAVFAVLILADALAPLLARRRLARELRARLARERRREPTA